MKKILRSTAFACLMAAASLAQATTYTFSYNFINLDAITGRFDGDANGDLITNLSNISVSVNGIDFYGNGNLFSTSFSHPGQAAVISFSGTQNDLYFGSPPSPIPGEADFGLISGAVRGGNTDLINYSTRFGRGAEFAAPGYDVDAYSATRWSVSAVPEADTYAMLLAGLGLVGVLARRRHNASA